MGWIVYRGIVYNKDPFWFTLACLLYYMFVIGVFILKKKDYLALYEAQGEPVLYLGR